MASASEHKNETTTAITTLTINLINIYLSNYTEFDKLRKVKLNKKDGAVTVEF